MYIMRNLPAFLALTASVIISILGIYNGNSLQKISISLVISIIAFYLFGVLLRELFFKFLLQVLNESERKARLINESKRKEKEEKIESIQEEELEPFMPDKL